MLSSEEIYKARDIKSKEKCIKFFGDHSLPIQCGLGNNKKVQNMLINTTQTQPNKVQNMLINTTQTQPNITSESPSTLRHSVSLDSLLVSSPVSPSLNKRHSFDVDSSKQKKIIQILGETCPVDVSIKTIQQHGLHSLLESKVPLVYFLAFLLSKRIPENLFFLFEVKIYQEKVFETPEEQIKSSQDLFHTYLSKNSQLELNISHKSRIACADQVKFASRNTFDAAVQEILPLLESAFQDFKASELFEKLGHLANVSLVTKGEAKKAKEELESVLEKFYGIGIEDKDPQTLVSLESLKNLDFRSSFSVENTTTTFNSQKSMKDLFKIVHEKSKSIVQTLL